MNVIQSQNPQLEIINNKSQRVQITLHDLNGQLIETVFEGLLSQGENSLSMQTFNIPSGVYLIMLTKEDGVASKRVMIP
jgi:hypothetical protein